MKKRMVLTAVTLGLLWTAIPTTADSLTDAAKQEAARRARLAEERAKGVGAYANRPAAQGTYSVVPVNPGYLAPPPTTTPHSQSAAAPAPWKYQEPPPPPTTTQPPDPRLKRQEVCQEGLPPRIAGNELGNPGVKPYRTCTEVR